MEKLDERDIQILHLLEENARLSTAEIARKIKISPPSVFARIRKLEEAGFVEGYTTILDPAVLGYNVQVIAMISLSLHQDQPIETFIQAVEEIPEVLECLNVSGDFDFLLRIRVRDISDYRDLVYQKLSTIKGVGKIQSAFVLGQNKRQFNPPLG